jgi:hypothetical protein
VATALSVCQEAYRWLRLDQSLISFAMSEFPYSIARDVLLNVLRELNRLNKHRHMQITQYVPAAGRGVFSIFEFAPVLNPLKIIKIRLEAPGVNHKTLTQLPSSEFLELYPEHETKTGRPVAWTYFASRIATDVVADTDYGMVIYYQQQLPLPQSETEDLAWPETDMDILTKGVIAYTAEAIQREDARILKMEWKQLVIKYFANQYKSLGLPLQMPARF